MRFELPAPSMSFDVALEDGAKIRMRRHGNPDGVRLLLTHGNGFAADAYYPYWQHLLQKFDLLVFDFRNHGQNVPVVPSHHTYEQLTRDLERVVQEVKSRLGARPTAGLFHSMSGRTAMKHAIEIGWRWDALVLFDPPNVPPPGHPAYAAMAAFEKKLTEWARQRRRRFAAIDGTGRGIPAVARHGALGRRRARIDGALGAAQEPGRRRLRIGVRSGKRSRHLRAGDELEPVAESERIRRSGQIDRLRSGHERLRHRPGQCGARQPKAATITASSKAPGTCCRSRSRKTAFV